MRSTTGLVILLVAFSSVFAYPNEDYYLIPNVDTEKLYPFDRELLDSGLSIYHSEADDSIRIGGLLLITENLYDDSWYAYNLFLDSLLENKLAGDLDREYKTFYTRAYGEVLNNHGYYYRYTGDPDRAMEYFRESMKYYREVKARPGISELYNKIGQIFRDTDRLDSSVVYFLLGAENGEKYADTVGMIMSYNNLGNHYADISDLSRAMDYLLDARDLSDALGYAEAQLAIINNISGIYSKLGQEDHAFEYLQESIELCLQVNDLDNLPLLYNNAGSHYYHKDDPDSAMIYYRKALSMGKKTSRPFVIAVSQKNIGGAYEKMNIYDSALFYYNQALPVFMDTDDRNQASYVLSSMAEIYLDLDDLQNADHYGSWSYELAVEIQEIDAIRYSARAMKSIRAREKRWDEAYSYFQTFIRMRDSVQNRSQANSAIYKELTHEYEKEQALHDAEARQTLLLSNEREKRQQMVTYGVAGGFLIVLLMSYFLYERLKVTQGQKKVIESQKREVELAHDSLEKKNTEILDSIYYAKRIQQALLKSEEQGRSHLPEHFIFFMPKDIVSGDFYWVMEKEPYLYLSAGDCTGHGVPGAFLTMLGTSFLNEINAGEESLTPAEILNRLRDKIIRELGQSSDQDATKDGMDISLIRVNLDTLELNWTGAHNPLYLVQDGELSIIKADKQPIGYYDRMTPFSHHSAQLKPSDQVYLFTDGFSDQFGGPNGKKYMSKKFKELILEISVLEPSAQRDELENEFNRWKGELPQLDDVCVIGLKV